MLERPNTIKLWLIRLIRIWLAPLVVVAVLTGNPFKAHFLMNVLMVYLFDPIVTLIHEMGHSLIPLCLGTGNVRVRFGAFTLSKPLLKIGRLEFHWDFKGLTGCTEGMIPQPWTPVHLFAGPASPFLCSLALLILTHRPLNVQNLIGSFASSYDWSLALMISATIELVRNLFPFSGDSFRNQDGRRILEHLARQKAQRNRNPSNKPPGPAQA